MTGLVFVRHGTEPPAGATDRRVVLLDETSTSRAAADPAAMPIHEVLGTALAAADAHRRSLATVDEWADAARIVDRLTIDDVAWWYRIREAMVGWVHERLVWRAILAELAPDGATSVHAPETELALVDVARAFGATVTTDADGRYEFRSVLPGRYLNGATYRPRHIQTALDEHTIDEWKIENAFVLAQPSDVHRAQASGYGLANL